MKDSVRLYAVILFSLSLFFFPYNSNYHIDICMPDIAYQKEIKCARARARHDILYTRERNDTLRLDQRRLMSATAIECKIYYLCQSIVELGRNLHTHALDLRDIKGTEKKKKKIGEKRGRDISFHFHREKRDLR